MRGEGGVVAIVSVWMSVHVSPLTASSHEPENLIRMQQGVFVGGSSRQREALNAGCEAPYCGGRRPIEMIHAPAPANCEQLSQTPTGRSLRHVPPTPLTDLHPPDD